MHAYFMYRNKGKNYCNVENLLHWYPFKYPILTPPVPHLKVHTDNILI